MTSEATTTAGTRAFVDAMLAHNKQVRAEIEQAAADLARAGITGPVLDGLHAVAGHYGDARGRWEALSAAIKQHEALAEQARATGGAATDMSFYTDDTKEAMTASTGSTGPAATDTGALPDTAGLTDTEHWHGSDAVTAASGDGTVSVGLCQYPDSDAYVVLATTPVGKTWAPDTDDGIDPPLSRKEAGQVAKAIDDLVAHARSGAPLRAPTKMEKLAARIRLLGDSGVTIAGDEGEIEVSAADLRKLLDAAVPAPAVPARRKIATKDCLTDGMDTGAVWVELDTSGNEPVVTIASTEGEPPESYPAGYTVTRLSLAEATDLAAKVRRFATATAEGGTTAQPAPPASAAAPEPAVAAEPVARRVTNPRGTTYEFDPGTGTSAVIERDGWRAVLSSDSPSGIAARLLYWNAEIRNGRGDDATETAGRELLGRLSVAELQEVAAEIGSSARGARSRAQLTDLILRAAITAARNARALRQL